MRVTVLGIKTLPAFAGADRVVERILENLPGDHHVTVYLIRGQSTKLTCGDRRHYVYVPAVRGKHLRAFSYFLLCTLHFVVKGRSDVVHVHNSDFGLFCPLLKLRRGVRVIGTFHGNPYERAKWGGGARTFLRLSEWVFVRMCDELTSVASSKTVPGRAVHYIPNGIEAVPESAIGTAFPYEKRGLVRGEYLMFACGRLDATKGLHHLLDAYRDSDERRKLLVVGDFSHDAAYTRSIERYAAADDRIVLWPHLLDRESLFDVMGNACVFVFPSDVEAMSMMLLEAVACRVPIVCSDIPENRAVVGDAYPYLFAAGDARSLAEVLAEVLSDTDAAAERVQDRFDEVTDRFRWSEIGARYESLYMSNQQERLSPQELVA